MTLRDIIKDIPAEALDYNLEVVYRQQTSTLWDKVYTLADIIECKSPDGTPFAKIIDFF